MSKPAAYHQTRPDPDERARQDAHEALDALVIMLHRHGVLRLAHDVTGALAEVGLILARELDSEGGRRGASNLFLFTQTLARISPETLQRVTDAIAAGFEQLDRRPTEDEPYPPGLTGLNRLLRDDELWDALGPLLEGLKAFAAQLRQNDRGAGHDKHE